MARSQKTETVETKAPDLIAFHVTSRDDKSYWQRIGAAWRHADGKGTTLRIKTLPIDGCIVLREPLPANENRERP